MQLHNTANILHKFANKSLLAASIFCVLYMTFTSPVIASNLSDNKNASNIIDTQLNYIKYALKHSNFSHKKELKTLYELQGYELIWSNGEIYNDNAEELYSILLRADDFGLNPQDYDVGIIKYFLTTISDPKLISKSDVTFSHAYIKFSKHLALGKFNTSNKALVEEYSLIEILNDAINNRAITIALENFIPHNTTYEKLSAALKQYRAIEENHEPIFLHKKSLSIGDRSNEIIKLKKRLHAFDDYSSDSLHGDIDLDSDLLDESVALAISKFQLRHGLEADGILGRNTVRELNKSIAERIYQLELNLDRSRTLPDLSNKRHLVINIPDYRLYLIENDQTIYQSRVVVGKKKHKTPLLSSELTELILNPYWHVPKSIASNEIIPKLLHDPGYLEKNNMKVLGKVDNKTRLINPETIDWTSINLSDAALRIRQDPGKSNSLGRIKFIFPNSYNVYLHDTPSRYLFARNQRAYSHGCIRVEDPFGLVEVLLADDNSWSMDDLYQFLNRNRTKTVKLANSIPIHITYMTAWVDDHGIVNFRPDIYKRDSQFATSLYNAPSKKYTH